MTALLAILRLLDVTIGPINTVALSSVPSFLAVAIFSPIHTEWSPSNPSQVSLSSLSGHSTLNSRPSVPSFFPSLLARFTQKDRPLALILRLLP